MNNKGYSPKVVSLDNNIIIKNIEDFEKYIKDQLYQLDLRIPGPHSLCIVAQ